MLQKRHHFVCSSVFQSPCLWHEKYSGTVGEGDGSGPWMCPASSVECWTIYLRGPKDMVHSASGTSWLLYTPLFSAGIPQILNFGCPSRNHVKPPMFTQLYSLVLDLAWLETPGDMLALNFQGETFLLFQKSNPRAPLMRPHIGWGDSTISSSLMSDYCCKASYLIQTGESGQDMIGGTCETGSLTHSRELQ